MQQLTVIQFDWSGIDRDALIKWVDACLKHNIQLVEIAAHPSGHSWVVRGKEAVVELGENTVSTPTQASLGEPQSVLTLMHPELTLSSVVAVVNWLKVGGYRSVKIDWMCRDASSIEAVNIYIEQDITLQRPAILELAEQLEVDLVAQLTTSPHKDTRLLVMDMDSTVIQIEVIDELAKIAGVGEQVVEITEMAMQGKLDFSQSLRKRVGLLEGLAETAIDEVAKRLPLSPGVERLMRTLHQNECKTAILSGGFTYFASRLQQRLGIDFIHSNLLQIVDGKLTGQVDGTIVDAAEKERLLGVLANELDIDMSQTMAVGDGANDLLMIGASGFGVAYRAKPVVRQKAPGAIRYMGLDGLLYIMGLIPVEDNA